MTARIQVLPEQLCNQIAAGEVVERPSSVVKELVENALDAGATQIIVEIMAGGRKFIRVTDDGAGMDPDDLYLCLERHATSKIRKSDDLFQLETLGFRGEALPSIAAVSRMTLSSRTAGELGGLQIVVEGGAIRKSCTVGLPTGTSVEVRDLFFNVPARRKFLRRDETEFGHIAELVTRLALSAPHVRFRLLHDERSILDLPSHPRLEDRLAALFGRPLLADLVNVDFSSDILSLSGYISAPTLHRASTASIYTFINGRYIRDRLVQHAVLNGLRDLIPKGRYPVAVLFLRIAPSDVDVNVHPTKHEVRFRRQSEAHDAIVTAVRTALKPGSAAILSSPRPPAVAPAPAVVAEPAALLFNQSRPGAAASEAVMRYSASFAAMPAEEPLAESGQAAAPGADDGAVAVFTDMRILGQIGQSYIVAEDLNGLVLIDQHAAHERIGYERLRTEFSTGRICAQDLLYPPVLELDYREAALIAERLEVLDRLGFALEPFGQRSFVLKSVPQLLASVSDPVTLVRDLAAELAETGSSSRIETACEKILITMSCHSMVRAHHSLTNTELKALLAALDQTPNNATCPHGRPVVARLGLSEIARLFRRNG